MDGPLPAPDIMGLLDALPEPMLMDMEPALPGLDTPDKEDEPAICALPLPMPLKLPLLLDPETLRHRVGVADSSHAYPAGQHDLLLEEQHTGLS